MLTRLILGAMGIVVAACAHHSEMSMTFDQCRNASICTVQGMASYELAEPAMLAKIDLTDGHCVNASLPMSTIRALQRAPRTVRVRGRVIFPPPNDPSTQAKINGRIIGRGRCGDFLIIGGGA